MGGIGMILGLVLSLVSLVCWIIVLIDAFKNEVWKGIVGLLCGLYLLYYGITEFEHPNKWLIVGGGLLAGILGTVVRVMSMGAMLGGGLPQ